MVVPLLRRLDELGDLVERYPDAFVRFSDGPQTDATEQSVDYESGLSLPGLSVNRLAPRRGGPVRWWTGWHARSVSTRLYGIVLCPIEAGFSRAMWLDAGPTMNRSFPRRGDRLVEHGSDPGSRGLVREPVRSRESGRLTAASTR